ncbi:glycoside hydrolase family 13 protein [Fibrobacter sp. UWB10]|uniref:glycoside hydrolase family 13 protein n=1 Tax=Fibrobacter sp. UWB10 TaxID=1896201 RepID=UPI002403809E|nr:glycoside hydrolase family 13 protein [Fibrobacter sp. UWB10]SMP54879.1 pullulanase /isoamylase [Fibrobacter sp. UWB10]
MFAPAWVKDAIFYQIFPDRFCRSGRYKAVGKFVEWGSKPTRENMFGGNLAGIEDKLEYIAGLGVNAIYLCPIFKSNSNHRYHTVDYFEIDPVLGTLEDFDRLIKKAHKLKLRVILDGVFNHCSRGFFQFNSLMELGEHSPYVDWFHVKGWPLNAYTDKPNYECWWNFPALPKFNTDCPDVREYLFSVGEYWMKRGIDGWRLDVPNEIDDDSFWQEFRRRVKAVNPDAYIVGEIWDEPSRWLKGDQFDGVMNYMFRKAAMQFLFDEKPISIKEFGERMSRAFPEGRGDIPMNLLGSHDTTRLMSQPCVSLERIKLAYAILFFLPGAPCIYYGEELSMKGGKDPDNRRSVPWSKLAEMQAKPLYEFIKQMIALRKKNAVLRNGSLEIRAADNGFAIERSLGKKTMTLVVLQDGTEFKYNIV